MRRLATSLPLGLLGVLAPLAAVLAPVPATAAPADPSAAPGLSGKVVVAISVDGLNPRAITRLGPSGAPHLHRLLAEGIGTLNARTAYEQTVTLPNHASMMTGRRINPRKGGHGVTWDDERPRMTVRKAAGHYVASVFSKVTGSGGRTALFSTKPRFGLYQRSWPKGIGRFVVQENQSKLVSVARNDLVSHKRELTFLHFSLPDKAGHDHGFMSPAYVAAVARTDQLLGVVLDAITARPRLRSRAVVVLTSDHGGQGRRHRDMTRLANYRVPFVVWGAGIGSGDLYAANPQLRDPGTRRPSYAGRQPVRNGLVANLVTQLLGIGRVPGSELGVDSPLVLTAP